MIPVMAPAPMVNPAIDIYLHRRAKHQFAQAAHWILGGNAA